jgi:hypothetical protein
VKTLSALFILIALSQPALATEVGHCQNAELSVALNATDDSEDWAWVKGLDGETTYFRGTVNMTFDRATCTVSVIGPKDFLLIIDLSKASGDLNLTRNRKPLKEEFRSVTCNMSEGEESYPKKLQEMRKDILDCQSKSK